MSEFRLAGRYAKSLIELSQEKGQLEAVHDDMVLMQQTIKSSRDLLLMLKNPIIHADKKIKVLGGLFKSKVNGITYQFFELVVKKGREKFLPAIAFSFIEQYNRIKHIVTATFTTAVPVDETIIERIRKLVREKTGRPNIDLRTKVNAKLIGGFTLEFEDRQYDTSVFRNLETLDDNFLINIYARKYNA